MYAWIFKFFFRVLCSNVQVSKRHTSDVRMLDRCDFECSVCDRDMLTQNRSHKDFDSREKLIISQNIFSESFAADT